MLTNGNFTNSFDLIWRPKIKSYKRKTENRKGKRKETKNQTSQQRPASPNQPKSYLPLVRNAASPAASPSRPTGPGRVRSVNDRTGSIPRLSCFKNRAIFVFETYLYSNTCNFLVSTPFSNSFVPTCCPLKTLTCHRPKSLYKPPGSQPFLFSFRPTETLNSRILFRYSRPRNFVY